MAASTPKVSVITPTYNHAPYLAESVASVLAQTFEDWEQLVIDDGSTDDTARVAAGFRDPRVRYFRREHVGVYRLAETYNFALSQARAPLVAILEGDDAWAPDKLASQVPLLDDPGVVLSFAEIEVVVDGAARPHPQWTRDWSEEARGNSPLGSALAPLLCFEGMADPGTWVVRRSALEAVGGFQQVAGLPTTDYPTLLELCLQGRFAYLPRPLLRWRQHAAQTSNRHAGDIFIGAADHARRFYDSRLPAEVKARLPLSPDRLECRLERQRAYGLIRQGRCDLLDGRWREARDRFSGAFGRGSRFLSAASAAGWAASWLHADMEGFARLLGKPHFRRPSRAASPSA
ncbi:MAG: glycosyltransferase family 2 protein [Elusimicrobia bacterium]|nr:glycosyltransferase family 2 protein [Elusimicrobiota bacterium]